MDAAGDPLPVEVLAVAAAAAARRGGLAGAIDGQGQGDRRHAASVAPGWLTRCARRGSGAPPPALGPKRHISETLSPRSSHEGAAAEGTLGPMNWFERLCIAAAAYVVLSTLVLALLATRPRRQTSARSCGRPWTPQPRTPYTAAHRRAGWATDRRAARQPQRRHPRDAQQAWLTPPRGSALRRTA